MTTKKPIIESSFNFDWSLIPSFLAVIETGSLLAAARQLKQAQPTIGRHIDALESQLKVSLFERTGRGLLPTERALHIADFARAMQSSADDLTRSLTNVESHMTGTVRITASQTVATYVMPALLAQLREIMPQIQIELVASNEVKNLLRRESDIAIRMVRPTQTGLITRKIGDVRVGAFAHQQYIMQHGKPNNPFELLGHDLIGYDADDSIINGFNHFGIALEKSSFALRCDDHIVHLEALRAGLGIAFVASFIAEREHDLIQLLPELNLPVLPVWLTAHREIHGNPRIRFVFDFLVMQFMKNIN